MPLTFYLCIVALYTDHIDYDMQKHDLCLINPTAITLNLCVRMRMPMVMRMEFHLVVLNHSAVFLSLKMRLRRILY